MAQIERALFVGEGNRHKHARFLRSSHEVWTASSARAAANSFFFSASTFGYVRLSSSTASPIAAATTRRVNHLLSAGTTYHGACLAAVARIASSNACM